MYFNSRYLQTVCAAGISFFVADTEHPVWNFRVAGGLQRHPSEPGDLSVDRFIGAVLSTYHTVETTQPKHRLLASTCRDDFIRTRQDWQTHQGGSIDPLEQQR